MFCSKCGATTPAGQQFCGSCGASISGAPSAMPQPQQNWAMPNANLNMNYPSVNSNFPKTNTLALVGFILSLTGCMAIVALILSIVGLVQINQDPANQRGKGLAISGIVISSLVMFFYLVFIVGSASSGY